jgi:voltage-gated potassium channel
MRFARNYCLINNVQTEFTERATSNWRQRIYELVFEAETRPGKIFDITLITLSFYGLVDLLAILPTYISLFVPGTQYFLAIRILRLLRIFRVLKLTAYISESRVITTALQRSKQKIIVFLVAVITIVTVVGSLMYVVEGEENGFTDIPTSIYWAIVTLTTVGYGDLSPKTGLGKFLASIVMIMGYGIIAVPTGIVTAELARAAKPASTHVCPECHAEGHDLDAVHCKYCGSKL